MQKTLKNLSAAFAGESQARNRYTIYAKAAAKEGYPQISEIFLLTADNEREHAKWLFRMIQEIKIDSASTTVNAGQASAEGQEQEVSIEAGISNTFGDTITNLKAAIGGENYESTTMYPEFAQVAREEGLDKIANRLEAIGKAEIHHESRFKKLLAQLENKTLFKKSEQKVWFCSKCGYEHTGNTPPTNCPSCDHASEYFQLECEEY